LWNIAEDDLAEDDLAEADLAEVQNKKIQGCKTTNVIITMSGIVKAMDTLTRLKGTPRFSLYLVLPSLY
jgi:hypothetical protein